MNILLLGKNGQVGRALQRSLAPLGAVVAYGRDELDVQHSQNLRQQLRHINADVIVNATAYTDVDAAQTQCAQAYAINADAVAIMAEEAAQLGAWLVHYSTDYVFDGQKGSAYHEDDVAAPLSVYGASKWQGEQAIRQHLPQQHFIFRTSWVYALQGKNFAQSILNAARYQPHLRIVNDQYGCPNNAELIADVTALVLYRCQHAISSRQPMLTPCCGGTYHLSANGSTSWYDYGCFLLEAAKARGLNLRVVDVEAVSTTAYAQVAPRPKYAVLANHNLQRLFGLQLPDWRDPLQQWLSLWMAWHCR